MAYETTIDLAVCSDCGGRFVQPLEVATSTSGGWDVTLHCPECDLVVAGTFDQAAIARFDAELDRGYSELASWLDLMHEVNERDAIERFRLALECDAILPVDF